MTNSLWTQPYFTRLADLYAQRVKRVVAFCGAGASREIGLPNWDGLIERLHEQYTSTATTTLGEKITEEIARVISSTPNNWDKMEVLKENLRGQYEPSVRAILHNSSNKIPTFHKKIWDLDPDVLLSLNLDGLSMASYAKRKTGIDPNYYVGRDAYKSRNTIGGPRKLIVDLHGNIDNPHSWVLTRNELKSILSIDGYIEFIRSIFAHNIVIFYGIGIDDISVSGQIEYFKDINFISGDYFLIKRKQESSDAKLYENLPIQIIYTGEDLSWEDGFSNFIDTITSYKPADQNYRPISSSITSEEAVPAPETIINFEPDKIRKILAASTAHFFIGKQFDYDAYKEFCKKYDYAIHLSTRISPNTSNDHWLGNKINAELGKGNFGKVYSATNISGDPIAIKVAHADVRDDEAMLNSFRRGVESMRYLSTSDIAGVVKLIDASELPPSITMEYVQGIDLEKFVLDYYDIDVSKKLEIAKWVAEILFECHTHERVILHRDLRPSNVMISGDYWDGVTRDCINVLDFDLSWFKGASGSEFYMNATQALGFLAPEQLDTKSKYNTKTAMVDVYGVGMLLYFIVSADIPLANASTRTDWPERMEVAARRLYTKEWKSNPARGYRLIESSTQEAQEKRPALQYVISELQILIDTFNGIYPFDEDSVVEELMVRLSATKKSIEYNRRTRRGGFVSGAGAKVDFSVVSETIFCTLEYVANENTNRTNRAKFLSNALSRALDKLGKIGKIDQTSTSTNLGGNKIRFSFETPTSLSELSIISDGIGSAISEIAIKA